MARFEVSCKKGPAGEILVYGHYQTGNEPIFVQQVVVEELDKKGLIRGYSYFHINLTIDPGSGSYLLVSKKPPGTNVKAVRAIAYYIEIEETATSELLNL